MCGIHVEEAAPVGTELLYRFLAGNRAQSDGLLHPLEGRGLHRGAERLRQAHRHEGDRHQHGKRQEDVECRTGEIDPEVADRRHG